MTKLTLPIAIKDAILHDAIERDITTARCFALREILWNERYLTRAQLIARVELRLGKNCFGIAAWEDTFYRDMRFTKQAFEAAGVQYLIGGAIAEWAWGEPRATKDLHLVVKIPIKAINKSSKELEKRADIPINAIHMHSGPKPIYIRYMMGMSFDKVHSDDGNKWIMVLRLAKCMSIRQRI